MNAGMNAASFSASLLRSQRGTPVMVDKSGKEVALKPFPLTGGGKSEAWLQSLIHKYPGVLSVTDIEPGLGTPVAVAMEVPCAHGYIDNILLTADGNIVLVEAKLWSNPQARREVVAQALDYVAALTGMGYDEFEQALLKARGDGAVSLHAVVQSPLAEPDFIDAVTRNLARGRILAIVLGNGIREEVRTLTGFLQGHAGAHFTLALVQINLWADPATDTLIAVPDTLAQTVMIERGIVVIDDGIPKVVPMPVSAAVAAGQTMTSEMFNEALAKKDVKLPALLRAFVSQLAPLGIYTEQAATLKLLAQVSGGAAPITLGYITKNGQLWTENVMTASPTDAAGVYLDTLAMMVGGTINTEKGQYVTTNGKSAPNTLDLLTRHADEWFEAIARFIAGAARQTNA